MIDIIVNLLIVVGLLLIGAALMTLESLLSARVAAIKDEKLRNVVEAFVKSAEQIYNTGEYKKQYVVEALEDLGYKVNDYIDALIESAVYKLRN